MLTGIGLRNFKAFGDEMQEAPLSKITLIYGPNSGGKSSIIQALLLLKQSLTSRYANRNELVSRGTMVDLGSSVALLHKHDEKRVFELRIACIDQELGHHNGLLYKTSLNFSIEDGNGMLSSGRYQLTSQDSSIQLADSKIGIVKNTTLGIEEVIATEVADYAPHHIADIYTEGEIKDYWADFPNYFGRTRRNYGDDYHYDENYHVGGPFLGAEGKVIFVQYSDVEIGTGFLPHPYVDGLGFTEVTESGRRLHEANSEAIVIAREIGRAFPPIPITMTQEQFVAHQFSRTHTIAAKNFNLINYLGPLRSAPERLYRLARVDDYAIGIQGEYSANVLYNFPFIRELVTEWLKKDKFDIPYGLTVEKLGEASLAGEYIIIVLTDKRTNTQVTIADVGYGINQLLPVIIEGVASQEDSILCVEQPEIHLHPRLQANIADLMIDTIADEPGKRKQWIVETHSELLVRRIQTRIAEGDISSSDVSVLYVDPDDDDYEGSAIKQLRLDENGYWLDEWPQGFFEEGYKQTRLARTARRNGNNQDAS